MKKDYRKDLEVAARQMILVRRVDTLIRLILRTIMRNMKVNHAGIFLYDKDKQEYVVTTSKGEKGIKVPEGFAKIKQDNPLIRYFIEPTFKNYGQQFLLYEKLSSWLNYARKKKYTSKIEFLNSLREELNLYQAKACIPVFFRNNLIAVLFLGKKKDGSKLCSEELGFLSVLASDVAMAIQNAWLFEDVNKQLENNKKLFLNTVTALATAIEAKDKYTSGHTERVVNYALSIAEHFLQNASIEEKEDFKEKLRIAALLHDIGKIGVPEKVLNKKTPLTQEDREYIFRHPLVGVEILDHVREFEDVIVGVKYHHERYDGKGYPFRLKGDKIPIIASIISVADAFDAMTTDRSYRKALTIDKALEEIKKNSGKQFNPYIVDIFIKIFKENR
ncbi:MAG: HD domain-containing protein [Candidatus Omnitrophica bacterium]|nr:HD domain-containing protein [Candidatus Omnitrophota bacterium]MCM8826857.1 HD domain-containing protein [Candidatus Omnitrophota bacterium]